MHRTKFNISVVRHFDIEGLKDCAIRVLLATSLTVLAACGGGGGDGGSSSGGGATTANGKTLAVDANPLHATPQLDSARAVTQTVQIGGGTIVATGADGTVYTLDIPADALLETTAITMTPVVTLDGLEVASDAVYGVQLGPDGTSFHNLVTLTITPPTGLPIERQLPISWNGTQNIVSLASMDSNSAPPKLKLLHFSGYALLLATKGTNATLEPVRHRFGGDEEARLQSLAAERILEERESKVGSGRPASLGLDDIFKEFREKVINPRIAAAGTSCAAGRLATQTILGHVRQRALLGLPDDGLFKIWTDSVIPAASAACTKEEFELCRDEHIVTRILPYYLALRREAILLGFISIGTGISPDPLWVQDAEAAASRCLNFELQLDSRLDYSAGTGTIAHTTTESMSSRLKLPLSIATVIFGSPYVAVSTADDPLVSTSYETHYSHLCASVSEVERIGASMRGLLGIEREEGGIAQQAKVKDFFFTPAVIPNGLGSGYTLTLATVGASGCVNPLDISPQHDNWMSVGLPTWTPVFKDAQLGLAIRNWTIVGGDIMATKDFVTQAPTTTGTAKVTTNLVLFHLPLP